MGKVILSLLLLLALRASTIAQQSVFSLVEHTTFATRFVSTTKDGKLEHEIGTAFCVPDHLNVLLTAQHAVGPEFTLSDYKGDIVEALPVPNIVKEDVALIITEDPVCQFSRLKWADHNAEVGTSAWLYGYGSGFPKPVMTKGIISSETHIYPQFPQRQLAQLEALFGHSGSPILSDDGKIIGMLVGGFSNGGEMNSIIPVELLKKAVK